ncbi:MAG: ABC transporter ATP-binding protein, partial [Clostridiales bacterium]|nr:ABC transporter ATP-binding protein [Clostridiales bacterium]
MKIIKKLRILLDKKQKRTVVILVIMMVIGALLEMTSITLIAPVIAMVVNPNAIETNEYIRLIYDFLHMTSTTQFTILVMIALIAAFIIKNVFLFVQQKALLHFVYTNQFKTSERMMKNYMRKSYEYYLNADTAVIQRNITADVNNMYALILSFLMIISEFIMFAVLSVVLFAFDAGMTIVIAVLLIITLFIIKVV